MLVDSEDEGAAVLWLDWWVFVVFAHRMIEVAFSGFRLRLRRAVWNCRSSGRISLSVTSDSSPRNGFLGCVFLGAGGLSRAVSHVEFSVVPLLLRPVVLRFLA
ncbi:hypothetical protein CFN78_06600 [Amycolatopsis antarctica]|uniref:Uncharacterized protein n=1 Tax=Amycolatopsis antarctica TaxID=1854586 RepID=A0A263D6B2_9PSEU|nr:hypothetical protein CFN78_06600 [Amycolatopsis antarctica]